MVLCLFHNQRSECRVSVLAVLVKSVFEVLSCELAAEVFDVELGVAGLSFLVLVHSKVVAIGRVLCIPYDLRKGLFVEVFQVCLKLLAPTDPIAAHKRDTWHPEVIGLRLVCIYLSPRAKHNQCLLCIDRVRYNSMHSQILVHDVSLNLLIPEIPV
jgi:hypothetical protein